MYFLLELQLRSSYAPRCWFSYFLQTFFYIVHVYSFLRKQIVSLLFERDVRTRLEVAISEVSGPPVFHIKVGASR